MPRRSRATPRAERLNRRDWHDVAAVTDDVVVVAVDYELGHLTENLDRGVPAGLRAALARRALA